MFKNIQLRAASADDSEFCYQVKKAALGPYVAQVWGWDEEFQRVFHERDFALNKPDLIIYQGHPIGTFTLNKQPEYFHVTGFYISPEFQGRGIGSALLQQTIEEATCLNVPVRLEVLKVNPAKRLYVRHGFHVIGEKATHYFMQCDVKK